MAEKPTPTSLPKPEEPDPDTDASFDYGQKPEADGVPVADWLPEQPYDSADWLDKPSERRYSKPDDEPDAEPDEAAEGE